MSKEPKYGDLLTFCGKTFRFCGSYEGSDDLQCIAEAVDPEFDPWDERWRYLRLFDNYFALYYSDCQSVSLTDPQVYQGLGI